MSKEHRYGITYDGGGRAEKPPDHFQGRTFTIENEGLAIVRVKDHEGGRLALCYFRHNQYAPLVYFEKQSDAELAKDWLTRLTRATPSERDAIEAWAAHLAGMVAKGSPA
jgi:hypothetical protein